MTAARQVHPDLAIMRETAAIVLDPAALAASRDEIAALIEDLTGHLHELVPAVEELTGSRPSTADQVCALAGLAEARRKLGQQPEEGREAAHARRLARVLVALSAHWETLSRPPVSP
ncbi:MULTISPECIES: DUF6415 family natural product biosynthesis protein [Streptomyces]|uniref:DUF6415 family natural product biosynthesis protein n=1 Tax=Streptomyces doudnae TaxID=3075536 RepID=A0ABD5EZQ3_9ACTN|nr:MULTISPECIES: DUF6415 family natural product biosynthesis protein [unclassified Streptomyces]MDT0440251.1 DUF6415 family natural product biosynthesis protein [Streptomyces sp. DSM 41981]MYQ63178.1 hypothetical protein [Streptomyces sp. SID4950]SCD52652.1 hypothetical protein GA0115242_10756 [Streptomyces sp. SolWspMP-5a-2]